MSKVMEPLGSRVRIGTQGYLVSVAVMLTIISLPLSLSPFI